MIVAADDVPPVAHLPETVLLEGIAGEAAEPLGDVDDLLRHGLVLAELEEVGLAGGDVRAVALAPVHLRIRRRLHELVVDAIHQRAVALGLLPLLLALRIIAPRRHLLGALLEAFPAPDVDDLVALLAEDRCPEADQAEAVVLPLVHGEAAEAVEERGELAGGNIVATKLVEHHSPHEGTIGWALGYHLGHGQRGPATGGAMLVRFWGTRGSLAKPGPTTVRYGGNTSCVEVRLADGTLIVLDCGTGAHGLGQALLDAGQGPLKGHLLITHTHWDHIQGFPFFAPLFARGSEWDLYAPGSGGSGSGGKQLETTLAGQMEWTYFPVTLEQLDATIRFHDLVESQFAIASARVITQYLNHPAVTLGYRLEADGVAVVYAVDHEPHGRALTGEPAVHHEDQRHVAFLSGADLVIHDAQYTIEEYPKRMGWGHSPAEWAVDYAVAAGAKRLALFHHDPLRDDDAVDRLVGICRQRVAAAGGRLEVFAAAEGQVVELAGRGGATAHLPGPGALAAVATENAPTRTILVADDDPTIVAILTATLIQDGFRVLTATDGETALRLARAERPALILLDWHMPVLEGIEVTRILRTDADASLRDVPVVLLTGETGSESTAAGFAAGVTDYLTKPFKAPFVRARIRAWLERGGAGARTDP